MMISIKCGLLSAAMLGLSIQLGLGEAPSGLVYLVPAGGSTAVWDLSGGYPITQVMQGAGGQSLDLSFGIDITQDARGRLQGSGQTLVGVGNNFVAANYSVSGRISGGGSDVARASLVVRMSGEDVIAGVFTPFSVVIIYNVAIDTKSHRLFGMARGRARFGQLGSATINSLADIPLPAGMNGTWSVQMNIVPLQRLGGTGAIVLSNGRILPVSLTGSFFSPDTSRVRLFGLSDARGTALDLQFDTVEGLSTVLGLRGRILGQVVVQ